MLIQELVDILRKTLNSKTINWQIDLKRNTPYLIGSALYENREKWEAASNQLYKFVKGDVDQLPEGSINLHDEASIDALVILTKEDGPTINIINTWYYLDEKAKGRTKVLWEYYENLDDYLKNGMLLTIMRIEGKESKAITILEKKKSKGELTEYEISNFNFQLQELEIEDSIRNVSSHVSQLTIVSKETREKVERLYKGNVKKETIEIIERYEEEINELEKKVTMLEDQLKYKSVPRLERFIEQFEDRPLAEDEKRNLRKKFESILKVDCSSFKEDKERRECRRKKGKELEDFCESFFTAINGISVYDRNVNFETEEIDLFLQNNTRKPYWNYLQSPNIIVECKNWTEPVGADEVRSFRQKINDHRNLIKIGFFIAINGFTEGLTIELVRSQKDENVLGIITKEDFEEFFNSNNTILEFLESIIFKSIK